MLNVLDDTVNPVEADAETIRKLLASGGTQ